MARIRGKNTKSEWIVRRLVHRLGFRYRLHVKNLPGTPDIVLPRHGKVIFVHGCFWHQHPGCKRATIPEARGEWWRKKLQRNVQRDEEALGALARQGWNHLVIWECQLRDPRLLEQRIREYLSGEPE